MDRSWRRDAGAVDIGASRAIRELERELGLVLFVRTTRHVELTRAGSALLVRARQAIAEVELAVDDARRTAHPERGALAIGPARRGHVAGLLRRVAAGELAAAAVVRAAGFELERTLQTISAPWDRRMLPVAQGDAVSVFVGEWTQESIAAVAAVPFDPPLIFPVDLATGTSSIDGAELLLEAALQLRDTEGWLTRRPARAERPRD